MPFAPSSFLLVVMASNLLAMAWNLVYSDGLQPNYLVTSSDQKYQKTS